MKQLLPFLILPSVLQLSSCENNPLTMREPTPVEVQQPIVVIETLSDSTFLIELTPTKILVQYLKKTDTLANLHQIESLVEKNQYTHVALKTDSIANMRDVDTVVAIFKRHKIISFNLVTDLEKQR